MKAGLGLGYGGNESESVGGKPDKFLGAGCPLSHSSVSTKLDGISALFREAKRGQKTS